MIEKDTAIFTEVAPKGGLVERFIGALGVIGSLGRSGQPLADSAKELTLSGIPASEIIAGLDTELAQAATEHNAIQISRTN